MNPKAQILTPTGVDTADTKIEEIALPPQEMWEELENSSAAAETASPSSAPASAAPLPVKAQREVAKLDFVSATYAREVPLKFPFRLGGRVIDIVFVRRLTIAELGDLLDKLPPQRTDNFEIYAAMTGLPAPILRGLIDVDGQDVTGACYDFLPRVFLPAKARMGDES